MAEDEAAESDDEAGDASDADGDEDDDDLDADAPGYSGEAESLDGDSDEEDADADEQEDDVIAADETVAEEDESAALARAKAESVAFARGDEWEGDEDADGAETAEGDADADDADEDDADEDEDDDDDDDDDADADDEGESESDDEAEEDEDEDEDEVLVATADGTETGAAAGTAAALATEEGAEGGGTAVAPAREESGGRSRRSRGGRRRGGRRGRGSRERQPGSSNGRGGARGRGRSRAPREMPPIQDILQKGQEIVVQVIKDGIGTKGPTLTTYLSIPGRFLVLMPGINKRGVSRKVVDGAERNRLKDIVRDLEVPEGLGFIVRTAGVSASAEDLQRDLDYLLKVWDQMRVRVEEHQAPVLLYQENDLVIRTLRDLYDGKGEVIVDDAATAEKARSFMTQIMPSCADNVQLYDGEKPLFNHYKVEDEIEALLVNRIELPSGGSLIIEQNEALVAIDVNSGRFKAEKGSGIEDTAFQVNSEAAAEVARQIRLRDLGGVVVVDFIDMRAEKHRKALEHLFKEALRRDRARIKVARFSPFGILELTRQRVRPSLKRSVHSACPYCTGTGYIPSDETSCLTVIRKVREQLTKPGGVLVVTVRPEVAEAVLNQQRNTLVELEKESHKSIFVRSDHRLSYEDVEVRAMVALPDDLDHRRA
jgi:ribonuclease E